MEHNPLLSTIQPFVQSTHSKSTRKPKLSLPLRELHRSSALSHRPLCDQSTQRQVKLSQRLLPKVYLRSLSRPRKQSIEIQKSHLEQWINNELQDDQTHGQGQLKAIRKYQIDKKSLLNMQLSSEEIDKLYQTLYVYSHGVKNAFLQLIGKSNEELMIRFWRVYILLLEDKNVSTLVERRHQQSLDIVMRTLKASEREVQSLRKLAVEKERKLNKEIVLKEDEIQRMKDQKDIIESNLLLTDEAFNQEVTRRLQFQQKINEINTIHNELKSKHRRLVEQLQIYQKIDVESKEYKKSFENEKNGFEIKITHLEKQVVELREKLKVSEEDSSLMKDEIHELKQEQLKMTRDDQKEYFQLKDVLIREKKYKLQLQNEVEAKSKIELLLGEKTDEINRLAKITDGDRERIEMERKKRLELEETINSLTKKVNEKQKMLKDVNVHNESLVIIERADKKMLKELGEALESSKNMGLFQERSIATLEGNIKNLDRLVEELKGSKHKHQTISQTLTLQNSKLLQTVKQLKNQQYLLKENSRELSMKLVQKESLQNTKEMNIRNQIQINKQKIKSLTVQLNNKQKFNSQVSLKLTKLRQTVIEKEYNIEQLRDAFVEQERSLNLEAVEKKSLESRLEVREGQLVRMKEELREMCNQLLEIKSQDMSLTKTNLELMFIQENNQKSKGAELETLKRVIVNYRKQIKSVNSNIHPMDYWSKEGEAMRLVEKLNRMNERVGEKEREIEEQGRRFQRMQEESRVERERVERENRGREEEMRAELEEKIGVITEVQESRSRVLESNGKLKEQMHLILKQKQILSEKYTALISKKMKSTESQTQSKVMIDEVVQTEQWSPEPQSDNQARQSVDRADKETDTAGLGYEYGRMNKMESPLKSTSPFIREQYDGISELEEEINEGECREQLRIQGGQSMSVGKSKGERMVEQQVRLKPVSKEEFKRAIRLTFMKH